MALDLDDIAFLSSERGAALLSAYAERDLAADNTLPLLLELRQTLNPRQAAAVLTTLRLRQKAVAKFPRFAQSMLFTAAALQQASHPLCRQYRADQLGAQPVLDVCCGIGADSLAFAAAGAPVLGLDIDPVRIAIARHNAAVMGLPAQFQVADACDPLPASYDCIFYDPARRDAQGRRIRHVERSLPPLALARTWGARQLIVKLSPAVDLRQLESYGGSVEFISAQGQLTEALLWLRRRQARPFATKLTGAAAYQLHYQGAAQASLSPPQAWLFEPDPAVLRAGLVRQLAVELEVALLDETIAYLTLEKKVPTVWGRYWKILDWLPFQLKRLRRYLTERGVGRVTVKKRGFAMSPEALIARLRLKGGGESRVLALTRSQGRPIVIICEDSAFG